MSSWHSYPSSFNLGHAAVRDLLTVPHWISEKVDGSQFSFGSFSNHEGKSEDPLSGEPLYVSEEFELRVRSKGTVMHPDAPEKMFSKAVASVKERQHLLHPGWTYRGEYLQKPKHNALAYDRVPVGHIILFDVSTGEEEWLAPWQLAEEAVRIGLECVPFLHGSMIGGETTLEQLRNIIDNTDSILGGQKIEGIVIKPLVPLFGRDKKTLMGKFVGERFKEVHKREWTGANSTNGDVIDRLIATYRSEGRWLKAIQHLREAGKLEDSPKDIGLLIREIPEDIEKEEAEAIKAALYAWAWPKIRRGVATGVAEFYKDQLLKAQFGE